MSTQFDMMKTFLSVAFALWAAFSLGCDDNPTAARDDTGTVKLVLKTTGSAATKGLAKATESRVTLTRAVVVIKRIRFESSIHDTLDFRLRRPIIQNLATGSDIHQVDTVRVPFGRYKKSKIKIDELDAEDGAVFFEHPELQELSIRVEGFVDGDSKQSFVFLSDEEEEQEREFEPLLVLDENSPSTTVVLVLRTDTWFMDEDGGFLDPRGPENHDDIEENIEESIEVFEDRDDDGERD